MENTSLWQTVKDNLSFVLVSIIIVAVILCIALVCEKLMSKGQKGKISSARYIAICGLMSAIAMVLMYLEIPLFFAPSFYKLDFSEIPVLIGTFSLGPVAGVIIELVKILLKLIFKPTSTAFVGELGNFIVGCSLVLPASVIYYYRKTRKNALIGLITGTVVMTILGSSFNAFYLIPTYARMFMPLDAIIGMGTAINSHITSVATMVLFAVVPFNLLKGILVTIITLLLYKRISPLLKNLGHK